MKKIYNMKKALLAVAALFICNMTFAQLTETSEGNHGGNKNTPAVGICYTISGDFIAGTGSLKVGTMASKGLKIRTAANGGTFVINVNKGYTIVGLVLDAVGNYAAHAELLHSLGQCAEASVDVVGALMMVYTCSCTVFYCIKRADQAAVVEALLVQSPVQAPPPFLERLDQIRLRSGAYQHASGQSAVVVVVSADHAGDDGLAVA